MTGAAGARADAMTTAMEKLPHELQLDILARVMRERAWFCSTQLERDGTRARVSINFNDILSWFDFAHGEVDAVQRVFGARSTVVEVNCSHMQRFWHGLGSHLVSADGETLGDWLAGWPVDRVVLDFTDLWCGDARG